MADIPLHEIRRLQRSKRSESDQEILIKLDVLENRILDLEDQLSSRLRGLKVYHRASYTTTGGAATEVVTLSGIKEGMMVQAQACDQNGGAVTVDAAFCGDGEFTLIFSADPGPGYVVTYIVFH